MFTDAYDFITISKRLPNKVFVTDLSLRNNHTTQFKTKIFLPFKSKASPIKVPKEE